MFDECRDYFHVRLRGQPVAPLADQRQIFIDRWRSLVAEVATGKETNAGVREI